MKKLLSAVLTIAMIVSVCLSATTNASAIETDTTPPEYLISERIYEEIKFNNGYVYGFIGDCDSDGEVSILDATGIQLHIAQLVLLGEDESILADIDFDSTISIIDATEIQLWVAKRSNNQDIAHTLYVKYPSTEPLYTTFDELAQFIVENRDEKHASFGETVAYFHNDEYDTNLELYYKTYQGEEYIELWGVTFLEGNLTIDTIIYLTRGETGFSFYSKLTEEPPTYYEADGNAKLISTNPDTFDIECTYFSSYYYDNFDEVGTITATGLSIMIEAANIEAKGHISGDVRDLFYTENTEK